MAKMLTEEEVKEIEKQRELKDRARAAGSTAGMSWIEKERFSQQQLNDRFRQAHEDAMERRRRNVLANPGAEANTNFRHSVMRDEEMRAARAHEMERLGKEVDTRKYEAEQKRMGMREQGRDAAEFNKEATIRAAELQTASAKEIAGINTASNEKIAGINAASNESINKDRNDAAVDMATINKEGTVEAAAINARAQAAKEYAQEVMKKRMVDEKQALEFAERRARMIEEIRKGRRITEEAATRLVDERLKGQMPGKPRKFIQ